MPEDEVLLAAAEHVVQRVGGVRDDAVVLGTAEFLVLWVVWVRHDGLLGAAEGGLGAAEVGVVRTDDRVSGEGGARAALLLCPGCRRGWSAAATAALLLLVLLEAWARGGRIGALEWLHGSGVSVGVR